MFDITFWGIYMVSSWKHWNKSITASKKIFNIHWVVWISRRTVWCMIFQLIQFKVCQMLEEVVRLDWENHTCIGYKRRPWSQVAWFLSLPRISCLILGKLVTSLCLGILTWQMEVGITPISISLWKVGKDEINSSILKFYS